MIEIPKEVFDSIKHKLIINKNLHTNMIQIISS